MNRPNPKKLLHSKWTAVKPTNKERHFLVTSVEFDDDGAVSHCQLEAIMTGREYDIDWRSLTDSTRWAYGWE